MDISKRLFDKIDRNNGHPLGCWIWTAGRRASSGVPVIWYKGRMENARRLVYALEVAPLGRGFTVDPDETCDDRCVNPHHGHKRASLTTRFGVMSLDALP